MPLETFEYDSAEFLGSEEAMDGNPEFGTIAKVADALGYRLNLVLKSDRGTVAAVK